MIIIKYTIKGTEYTTDLTEEWNSFLSAAGYGDEQSEQVDKWKSLIEKINPHVPVERTCTL
jgi:hypothetical protein